MRIGAHVSLPLLRLFKAILSKKEKKNEHQPKISLKECEQQDLVRRETQHQGWPEPLCGGTTPAYSNYIPHTKRKEKGKQNDRVFCNMHDVIFQDI
jgi:hypothetical protein